MTSPLSTLARSTLLVRDYDEALAFYRDVLGLQVVTDLVGPNGERMLHVGLASQTGVGLWLLKAMTAEDRALIGRQTGSHPMLLFYVADCRAAVAALAERGVKILEPPTDRPRAVTATFADLYGNRIAVVQILTG